MSNKLMFETGLDGSGFERGLAKLGSQGANSLKNFVVGAFGVYSIHQALSKTVESADELVIASKRLSTTVEQLQALRQAAKDSRLEFANLEKAFEGFNVARDKALSGGSEGAKMMAAFGRLGINEGMLRTQTAPQAFMGPLRQAALTNNAADLDAALKQILPGVKGFGAMLPFLQTNFEQLSDRMNKYGMIMSTESAAALNQLKDNLGLIGQLLLPQFADAILYVIDGLMNGLSKFLHFIDERMGLKGAPKPLTSGVNWKNVGTNARGVELGVIGGLEAVLGAVFSKKLYERGTDLMAEAELRFQKTGWTGGPIDKMADALNQSGGGMGDAFDAKRAAMKKDLDDLIQQIKNPKPPTLNPPETPEKLGKLPKSAAGHMQAADALVRTGNFLGSAKGQIDNLAVEANRLARQQLAGINQIARNTLPLSRSKPPGSSEYPTH